MADPDLNADLQKINELAGLSEKKEEPQKPLDKTEIPEVAADRAVAGQQADMLPKEQPIQDTATSLFTSPIPKTPDEEVAAKTYRGGSAAMGALQAYKKEAEAGKKLPSKPLATIGFDEGKKKAKEKGTYVPNLQSDLDEINALSQRSPSEKPKSIAEEVVAAGPQGITQYHRDMVDLTKDPEVLNEIYEKAPWYDLGSKYKDVYNFKQSPQNAMSAQKTLASLKQWGKQMATQGVNLVGDVGEDAGKLLMAEDYSNKPYSEKLKDVGADVITGLDEVLGIPVGSVDFGRYHQSGFGIVDDILKKFNGISPERHQSNWQQRADVRRLQANRNAITPSNFGVVASGVLRNFMPTLDQVMAENPNLSAEEAEYKLQQETADLIKNNSSSWLTPAMERGKEEIRTGVGLLAPQANAAVVGLEGIGMGMKGLAKAGKAYELQKTMSKMPYVAQRVEAATAEDAAKIAYAQKVAEARRVLEEKAKQAAQKADEIEREGYHTIFGKQIPRIGTIAGKGYDLLGTPQQPLTSLLTPALVGGGVGYVENPEHGVWGGITGAVTGGLLKKYGPAALRQGLGLVRDLDQASEMLNGKVGNVYSIAGQAEDSSALTKKLFGGTTPQSIINAHGLDWLQKNAVPFAMKGVHGGALMGALGILNDTPSEDLPAEAIQGALMTMLPSVVHHIGTEAPEVIRDRIRKEDTSIRSAMADMPDESRRTIENANWQMEIDRRRENYEEIVRQAVEAQEMADNARNAKERAKFQKVAYDTNKMVDHHLSKYIGALTADVPTRLEYNRLFKLAVAQLHELTNGSMRAGQQNVGMEILTTPQIVDRILKTPEFALKINQEGLATATAQATQIARQKGFSVDPESGITLDPQKPVMIINADTLAQHPEGPYRALLHEAGHSLMKIPQFADLMKETKRELLGHVDIVDGKIVGSSKGQYQPQDLWRMFFDKYMNGYSVDQIRAFADTAKLLDPDGKLNIERVVNYMGEEVMADAIANTLANRFDHGLGGMADHLRDWAHLHQETSWVARAIQNALGVGGRDPRDTSYRPITGVELSPEAAAATDRAARMIQNLNGRISPLDEVSDRPKMTRKELIANPMLLQRIGGVSGIVKTKMVAKIYDRFGKQIGGAVDIQNPLAAEGTWLANPDGTTKQTKGYGQIPDELRGTKLPDGARVEVESQVLYQPDGVTPIWNTPKETKNLRKTRDKMIRDAINNAPNDGTPNRMEPYSADELSMGGTLQPSQIKAILDLPESIVPLKIKENIVKLNDHILTGRRSYTDYSTHVDKNGNYVGSTPQIRDNQYTSLHFSKKGNFTAIAVSWDALHTKMKLLNQRIPHWFDLWGGNTDKFYDEFVNKYLVNIEQGRPNDVNLDDDPAISVAKRDKFRDFLGFDNKSPTTIYPEKTTIPRKKGEKKADLENVVRSFRLDAMMNIIDSPATFRKMDRKKVLTNFIPADEGEEPVQRVLTPEATRVTPQILKGITAAHTSENRPFGAQFMPAESGIDTAHEKAAEQKDEKTGQDLVIKAAEKAWGVPVITSAKASDVSLPDQIEKAASNVRVAKYNFDRFNGWNDDQIRQSYEKDFNNYIRLVNPVDPKSPTQEEIDKSLNMGLIPFLGRESLEPIIQKEIQEKNIAEKKYNDAITELNNLRSKDLQFKTGNPVTIQTFHATPFGELEGGAFDPEKLGLNTKAGSAKLAHFMSGSEATANAYIKGDSLPHKGFLKLTSSEKDQLMRHLGERYEEDIRYGVDQIKEDAATDGLSEEETTEKVDDFLATQTFDDWLEHYPATAIRDDVGDLFDKDYDTDHVSPKLYKLFTHFDNPMVVDQKGSRYREISYYEALKEAQSKGHDGVIFVNTYDGGPRDNIFAVLKGNENKIKSSDPFTYDENGKLIPLSQRFNPSTTKIAFLPAESEQEKYPTSEEGFYSGLQKVVDEKMPSKASPQQVLQIVNNPQNAKPEEVKWSNLAGFLEGKTNVTKQEVLDYLKNEGAVKFEEKTLGSENPSGDEFYSEDDRWGTDPISFSTIQEAIRFAENVFGLSSDEAESFVNDTNTASRQTTIDQTKHSHYTLPNGKNYREVVLTMPYDSSRSEARMAELNKKYNDFMESIDPVAMLKLKDSDPEAYKKLEDEMKSLDAQRKQLQNDFLSGKTGEQYTSSHFPEIPNYVAHMRLNERPDSEGRNGLFIEELQSDRHQAGREKGYKGDTSNIATEEEISRFYNGKGNMPDAEWNALAEKVKNELDQRNAIPDAPFRKDWSVQMFKRALRDAVASGKEWIGWTKGIDQVERYEESLRQAVDEINYAKNPDGTTIVNAIKDGKTTFYGTAGKDGKFIDHPEAKGMTIDEVVGKGIAQKIANGGESGSIKDKDLTIGGEGMKGFYDQILPKEIGKYVKKWGAKVEEGETPVTSTEKGEWQVYDEDGEKVGVVYSEKEAKDYASEIYGRYEQVKGGEDIKKIWKVKITPEMRESIKKGGQIQFMPAREPEKEHITSATYTNPRTGKVTEGATHLIANPNAPQEATDRESPAYGFKTSSGGIVDRATAYQMAKDAGQLKAPTTQEEKFHADRGILHSGMYEPKGGIQFMPSKDFTIEQPYDEFGDQIDDADSAVRKIAKDRNMGITSDRELSHVARDKDGNIIGGAFTSVSPETYSFDVVVDNNAEKKGVGSALLDEVIKPDYLVKEAYPDIKTQVDVINPTMKAMLEKKGFEVTEQIGKERWIMEPKGGIFFMPAEGESKSVPTQEELDKMKAGLPKYSAKTEKYSGKYGDVIKIYSPDRDREVGFAIIGKSIDRDNTIDIYETNVDIRYRGKGYGQSLYREIAKYAQKKGADTLFGGFVTPEAQKVREKLFETQPSKMSGFGVESKIPSNISFLPSDDAHRAAVESGDTEEAQRLVDEAARKAGYTTKGYHGTLSDFNIFNENKDGIHFGETIEQAKNRIKDIGGDYDKGIGKIIPAYLKLGEVGYAYDEGNWEERIKKAKLEGYNSLGYENSWEGEGLSHVLFDPSQIKSADPATYDKDGNLIPLSQRFNPRSNDIRFMPADADHRAAVESGDTEEAQRLVDEAAKKAGYDVTAFKGWMPFIGDWADTNFKGEKVGKGTKTPITIIDRQSKFPTFVSGDPALEGIKGFFSSDKNVADRFSSHGGDWRTDKFYLKSGNQLVIDAKGKPSGTLQFDRNDSRFRNAVRSGKYDSILLKNTEDEGDVHVILSSNNIKYADPATYDKDGNLIPLSQRFNPASNDIRFMPESTNDFEEAKAQIPSLLPINKQPENLPVIGRLTSGQQQAINELDKYYSEKTPERVQELKNDAEESLSSRLTNLGIPVSDSKRIASKAFNDLRKSVNGAMQVVSGMGLSDLSRMAGSGRPSVETRQKINPSWLTSAFESFETDDALALMKAQQVATQLNKADQAKVAAGEEIESAKASGVRQSTIEQGMNFVVGEKTADQKAFGSSLREDMDAPPRVYASVVEGQKYGSQGNYNLFFEWNKATPMVITSHHHYGVGNGLTDIHASANVGDKNARSFGDTTTEKYDTLPSGKKILNTRLLVGNDGASDIRAHQLMVSIPKSALDDVKRVFKASGIKAAEVEIDKIVSSQLVGQAGRGKAKAYTTDEGIPPYAAAQSNRTEAYVLNPDLKNVSRITIVSNKPKEIELIKKNLQKAFENNGTEMPEIHIVSKDSGPSTNTGRKAITDKFFKLTGKLAFMPEIQVSPENKINWSEFTQKTKKPLSTLKAYAMPQQQDENY